MFRCLQGICHDQEKIKTINEEATVSADKFYSPTLFENLLECIGPENSWCYKKKRDGNRSAAFKMCTTIVREGLCLEFKEQNTADRFTERLENIALLMNVFKTVFLHTKKQQVDFVDKFYKHQVQNDILLTEPAKTASGVTIGWEEHWKWSRKVVETMRQLFTVDQKFREEQQVRTNTIRTHGLEHPIKLSSDDIMTLVSGLWHMRQHSSYRVAASLCLLQLATGGRSRDVIFVNKVQQEKDDVRVEYISKRREDDGFVITKPILKLVFYTRTESFIELFAETRRELFDREKHLLKPEWVTWHDVDGETYPSMVYRQQWDKKTAIERIIQCWSARMRRVLCAIGAVSGNAVLRGLFGGRKGTHQLRKIYVACSYVQSGSDMKEVAWGKQVLGHESYDTSLLYTTITIKTST
jgi:hypothetical protein